VDEPFATLADLVTGSLGPQPPHIVGIGGAVAVGKSTVAAALAEALGERARRVDVVATDAFLYPNAVLHDRGLGLRKGFPESFDVDALVRFVERVRTGTERIEVPVYSHAIYDILPGETAFLTRPDLVLLEGVFALQTPVVEALDVAVYVHADEQDVRGWFVDRFRRLTTEARGDPSSFYAGFADIPADALTALAESTWDSINGVNLREHILPSRERATIVVEKTADHSIGLVAVV